MVRALKIGVIAGLLLYAADYAVVRGRMARGQNVMGTVQVNQYYAIAEKNNKTEYVYGSTDVRSCVHALFPHFGNNPCWYLNRHKTEQVDE